MLERGARRRRERFNAYQIFSTAAQWGHVTQKGGHHPVVSHSFFIVLYLRLATPTFTTLSNWFCGVDVETYCHRPRFH